MNAFKDFVGFVMFIACIIVVLIVGGAA